ncbi:MAG: hypothetical protein AAF998_14530 [Bacteroidota bacterium]
MLKESRSDTKYQADLEQVVRGLELKGYESIKADLPDLERPSGLKSVDKDFEYVPDVSAKKYEATSFFEISQKTHEVQKLVTKWKLLATVANIKRGKLTIYMPKGTMKFTRELVEQYQIPAILEKM